jgi:hypothetical protein
MKRALVVLPFALGLGWLVSPFLFSSPDLDLVGFSLGVVLAPLYVLVFGLSILKARAIADADERRRVVDTGLLLPCAFAPLLVAAPWTVAPSHFGIGLGSFPFFVAWLTRYPNVGPINLEVLLGIGAVLGTSALPAALAAHAWLGRTPRLGVVALLAALQLVSYIPVLVRLDLDLVDLGIGLSEGAPIPIAVLAFAGGPVLRLWATLAMLAYVPITALRARQVTVWES